MFEGIAVGLALLILCVVVAMALEVRGLILELHDWGENIEDKLRVLQLSVDDAPNKVYQRGESEKKWPANRIN